VPLALAACSQPADQAGLFDRLGWTEPWDPMREFAIPNLLP